MTHSIQGNFLPADTLLHLFGGATAKQLDNFSLVCTVWHQATKSTLLIDKLNVKQLYSESRVRFIDVGAWKQHLKVDLPDDASPLDPHQTLIAMKRGFKLPIECDAGITVLQMPKGLTLNMLIKKFHAEFRIMMDTFLEEYGDVPISHTYSIAFSNNLVRNSRHQECSTQQKLLEQYGCRMPTVLEAIALAIMIYKKFRIRLFGATFTTCKDQMDNLPMAVGQYDSLGLRFGNYSRPSDLRGVAAVLDISPKK